MIKTMRLQNFKAFEDTGDLEIKPLTVLAGPNSSGKSSILQSLLLLKQTLESPPDTELSLDGRFLQFSELSELTFGKPRRSNCKVSFKFELETSIPIRAAERYFPGIAVSEDDELLPLHSNISLTFIDTPGNQKGGVELGNLSIASRLQGVDGPKLNIKRTRGTRKTTVARHGSGIAFPPQLKNKSIEAVAGRHFLPDALAFKGQADDLQASGSTLGPVIRLDGIFLSPLHSLRDELEDALQYLGPLREWPQRAYLHSGNPMTEMGERGQHAAQILWLEKDQQIEYTPILGQESRKASLIEAVGDTFIRLGMAQPIDVAAEKSIMYQILFRLNGADRRQAVTIADVGFGVSQLLPILVLGLRAPEPSLLLLEQPEIHLHPKVQAGLADFFLTLSTTERRLIVETHSDHFINRLRRRIAEDPTDQLKDQVSILFIHPAQGGRGAAIEPLRVDRFGIIENWPPNFLPESADEAEAIVLAGLEKRRG